MGVAVADYDEDGDLDLYNTNITDEGGIGTTQGNVLYRNELEPSGSLGFTDVAASLGVEDTYWGWGTGFVDVENDGDLDIVAVTGFDEFILSRVGPESSLYQTPSVLFLNDGTGQFSRLLGTGLDSPDDSRAMIAFDYDRDGDRDLLVTNIQQPVRLFENVSTNGGSWLTVELRPDRSAANARVLATIGGVTKRRDVVMGRSYLAGTPPEVHFGLGASTQVDELRVHWADGGLDVFYGVPGNQVLRLERTRSVPISSPAGGLVLAVLLAYAGARLLWRRSPPRPLLDRG
jgi:hypothetical protein